MSTLVVPIDLAALCVGAPDTEGDDPGGIAMAIAPAADFSALPYAAGGEVHNRGPYLSAAVLSSAAPFSGAVPLLQGIHLHWALPDGLTHALHEDGALDFPRAPNRWLLTRVLVDTAKAGAPAAALKSWVVESDRLSPTAVAPAGLPQPTVPAQPVPGQNFRYIGQAFTLEQWQEQGDAVERYAPLTAVGYGEATFAALYPNSSTVFGFLDTLADVSGLDPAHTTVGYHVAGWYAGAGDPLASGAVKSGDNRYRWSWTGGPPPTATVCTGVIEGIGWDPERLYLGDAPRPLSVAIGNGGGEALAALMAAVLDPHEYPDAEQILDALQYGRLSRTGQVDRLAALDEAVHGAGFARQAGGWSWTVTATGKAELPPPGALGGALAELDALQAERDALGEELRALREQLFADWSKYLLCEYAPDQVPPALRGQSGAVRVYLEAELAAIEQITQTGGRADRLTATIAERAAALRATLAHGLELEPSSPADRYQQPVDPVLVLSGQDVRPPARYGNDGARSTDGSLPCRLDGDVVDGVTLHAALVAGSAQVALEATALPGLAAHPAGAPIGLAEALLREALLLSAAAQPVVAAAVAAQGGQANPAVLDLAATEGALAAAATSFLAGQATPEVAYAGSAPDAIMVAGWTGTPWLPVRLDYDVAFAPVQLIDPASGSPPYAPDFIDSQFSFDAQTVDLQYAGAPPGHPQAYAGSVILTPGAAVDLAGEIERYLDQTQQHDEELSGILANLLGLPVLAQRLTGALQALLMRDLQLQLPVADPLASPPAAAFAAAVAAAVGRGTAMGPLPQNSFNPIRAGSLRITRLRLVDAFGRYKDYDAPQVVVSHTLAPPAGSLPGTAFLPPRVTQPARLRFSWRSAADAAVETNQDPATTPIAGWLLPLWLDRAIGIYRADGTALGELGVSADRKRALWTPAPGGRWPPDTPIAQVLAGEQPDLRDAALALYRHGDGSYLAPFFDVLRDALTFSLPAAFRESAEAAVLAGQPLALARAGLRLELAGPPASDESWTSFAARVLNGAPADDAGLSGVRFPVVLGALTRLDDTLVGYWLPRGEATDYGTFYAPAATSAAGGVMPPAQDTVTLTPAGGSSTTTALLLLDPRGTVHATTGVLPACSLRIPPALYGAAIRALVPTLAARPLLSGAHSGPPRLALPKLDAGAWTWIAAAGASWASTEVTDARSSATLDYTPQRIVEGWLRHE